MLTKSVPNGSHKPQPTAPIKKVTIAGMVVNLVLSIGKFIVGVIGGSQAVVADAVHSLSDLGTDFAVLWGVRFWTLPADEDHPYGHIRIEAIVTGLIGISLGATALGIGYHGLTSIAEAHARQMHWMAALGAFFSAAIKEVLYRITNTVGRKVKSSALVANAWHHRSDALSSLPAGIAAAIGYWVPAWSFVDHVGAVIVCVFILQAAWKIVHPAYDEMVCRGVNQAGREQIRDIILGTDGVQAVHKIRSRRMGQGLYVDFHILVDPSISVKLGHEISAAAKYRLLQYGPDIVDVVIHIEPNDNSRTS